MSILEYNTSKICKYEVLAEISFHTKKSKNRTVKLLCSRLLARHRLRDKYSENDVSKYTFLNEIDTDTSNTIDNLKEHNINTNYKNKPPLINSTHSSAEELKDNKIICSQQMLSNNRNDCSSLQEQFSNLNTNDSELHTLWYAYWEKNGVDFVNETWIKEYGSCTTDDLPMDPEDLYKKHREQQYIILYWKFMAEMGFTTEEIEDPTNDNIENEECVSSYSEEHCNDNQITNFDFLYKYKHFQQLNNKLINAYRALSIIGHIYDDQNIFNSAFVEYLKTNIVKSTRGLNVYRFPKIIESMNNCSETDTNFIDIDQGNSNTSDENKQCESYVKSKNQLKREKKKQKKDKYIRQKKDKHIEDLKRVGYDYLQKDPKLLKYWKKRHMLFSKFEKGIQLDKESWYSVTPEIISSYIAERCSCYLIVDPFCGAGGNIIQFAKTCELVIAIDNDPKKIEIARHNAELYGVADRIQFIIGDYFALAPTLKADVVFLSPPWGGPDLMNNKEYKLSYLMPENGGADQILSLARQITLNVALHLPKNTNIIDCLKSADDGFVEVQQNMLNSRYNSITVFYSELYGLCDEKTDTYDDDNI